MLVPDTRAEIARRSPGSRLNRRQLSGRRTKASPRCQRRGLQSRLTRNDWTRGLDIPPGLAICAAGPVQTILSEEAPQFPRLPRSFDGPGREQLESSEGSPGTRCARAISSACLTPAAMYVILQQPQSPPRHIPTITEREAVEVASSRPLCARTRGLHRGPRSWRAIDSARAQAHARASTNLQASGGPSRCEQLAGRSPPCSQARGGRRHHD